MKFFTLECDWHKILEETRTAYQIWNQLIPPTAPSGQECDATLSKNTYNLINLTSPFPEYYSLWSQLFKNVRENMPSGPLWIHAWLNVHRSGELGKNSLGWHCHYYAAQHGFVHLSDKPTETVFSSVEPTQEQMEHWNKHADNALELDLMPTKLVVNNKQGQQYFGPGHLMHKVRSVPYEGIRASIGYDLFDDPTKYTLPPNLLVPLI